MPRYGDAVDEDPLPDEVRSPDEVATRALALFSVIALAFGADRSEITGWLAGHDLWRELAPSEAGSSIRRLPRASRSSMHAGHANA